MKTTIDYQRKQIKEGIDLHLLRTSKFKTTMIKIFVQERLRKETAPMVALISYLIFRGTNKRPTTIEMMRYLQELYGADLSTDVEKRGEVQYLTVTMEFINSHFLPGGQNLFDEGLEFILDVLTNSLSFDGKFNDEYFRQEKGVLRDDINSIINDKAKYASERCLQLMCPDELYGIYKYGSVEELERVENEELYGYYQHLLHNNPMHIFVIGDVDEQDVLQKMEKAIFELPSRESGFQPIVANKKCIKPQKIIEEEKIRQGKLSIGYRANINRKSADYPALQVFNGVFGSLPHSKLFQNVREKESLAYYIYTRLDSTKGLVQLGSGIESSDLDKVLQIIDQQLQAIIKGEVDDQELEFTKKAYRRYFKYIDDDNEGVIDSAMLEVTNGLDPGLDRLLEEIEQVTVEDVQAVAKKLQLDTIYFLMGKEGAEDEADDAKDV